MPRGSRRDTEAGLTASETPEEEPPGGDAPNSGNSTVLQAIASLHAELRSLKTEIVDIIDTRIDQLSTTIRGELTALKNETSTAILAVKATSSEHANKLSDLERSASSAADTITKLERDVGRLNKVVHQLSDKCIDLEGRSRRENLRILHVKEGAEVGKKPRDFVAQLLKDALSLAAPPLIDRCHRALGTRPGDNERPRPFILKMHYTRDVEEILRKAAEMQRINYNGQRILIFPDYPPAVVKQRALFKRARELLKDKPGVRFGMQYPAKLRVTINGKEHFFTDPERATEFAEHHFGAAATV